MKKVSCGAQKLRTLFLYCAWFSFAVYHQLLLVGSELGHFLCGKWLISLRPAVCISQPFVIRAATSASILVGRDALCLPCSDGRDAGLIG